MLCLAVFAIVIANVTTYLPLVNDKISEYANTYSYTLTSESAWLTRKQNENGPNGPPGTSSRAETGPK